MAQNGPCHNELVRWVLVAMICSCTTVPHEPRVPGGAVVRLGDPRFAHGAPVERVGFCGDAVIAVDRGGFVRAWEPVSGEGLGTWELAHPNDRTTRLTCEGERPVLLRESGERIVLGGAKAELGEDVLDAVGTIIVRVDRVERAGKKVNDVVRPTSARSSHDGRALAVFSNADKDVHVFRDVALASEGLSVVAQVTDLEWSDDDRRLLVSYFDRAVEVVTPLGKVERRFDANAGIGDVSATAATAKVIAIGTKDGILHRFDAVTGERWKELKVTEQAIESLAFSPDGNKIAIGTVEGVRVIATTAHDAGREQIRGVLVDAAFSLDGTQVATIGMDGMLRIWDATTGAQIRELAADDPDKRPGLSSVAWGLGGIVVVDDDGVMRKWDARRYDRNIVASDAQLTVFASSLDHSLLGGAKPEGWWLIDAGRLTTRAHGVPAPAPPLARILYPTLDATGRRFAYCVQSSAPAMIDVVARDGARVAHLSLAGTECPALALSPDGTQLALGTGVMVSLADTRKHATFSSGDHELLSFAPDGKAIVATHDAALEIIDLASHTTRKLAGHTGTIHSIAWSPTGDRFVTTSDDLTAIIWRR